MTLEIPQKPSEKYTPEQLQLIKNMACQGATDDEFKIFMEVCLRLNLNPFIKQIYSIKRGGQRTIQISIDGYRAVAERTGRYAPGKETKFDYTENGSLFSATAYVMKMTDDGKWHEVAATAFFDEYKSTTGLWPKMPRAMLSKCSESLALRKAFPSEFSGTYSEDEMQQADNTANDPLPIEVVTDATLETAWKTIQLNALFLDAQLFKDYRAELERIFKNKFPETYKKELMAFLEPFFKDSEKFANNASKWDSTRKNPKPA